MCRHAGGEHELKRECDTLAHTPMSAYNLRIYRQTYYGIRDVLAPLIEADSARIAPMQSTAPGRPTVVEVCPASLLKRLGLPSSLYKGRSSSDRKNRALILDGIVQTGQLAPPNSTLRRRLFNDPGGDALDSVLAAVGAYRAATSPAGLYDPVPASLIDEGWVYT